MKTYRLIKRYPGSPELGTIYNRMNNHFIEDFGICDNTFNDPEFSKYWEEVIEKDYEILSIWNGNIVLNDLNNLNAWLNPANRGKYVIHSIKRLSDGEIFTIGDNVSATNNVYTGEYFENKISINKSGAWVSKYYDTKIHSFKIIENVLFIMYNHNDGKFGQPIEFVKKLKQPLFTTLDNIDIFKKNTFYIVRESKYDNWSVDEIIATDKDTAKNYKRFSTKEIAEEYMLLNKPCLSINDVAKIFVSTNYTTSKGNIYPQGQKLRDLVKLKIQQSV